MADARLREAGRRLGEAWLAARPVDTFPDTLRARSRTEAYAIQDEMAAVIGFVFGSAVEGWRRHDLRNLRIDIRVDSREPAENFLGERRCEPIDALVQAAGILGERGIAIESGQYVSTGAATDPQPVQAGSVVRAQFGTLGAVDIVFVA